MFLYGRTHISDLCKLADNRKYGCVMVNLPSDLLKDIIPLIDVNDIAEDGVEDVPHVTVLYGTHTNDPVLVDKVIKSSGVREIKIKIGKLSLFENDQDVLKFDIISDDLHKLNKYLMDNLEVTNANSEYKPHLTVAYLKKGTGKKYLKRNKLTGKTFTVRNYVFSDCSYTKTYNSLRPKSDLLSTLTKAAMEKPIVQRPIVVTKSQLPVALILKEKENSKYSNRFYKELAQMVRNKGFAVYQQTYRGSKPRKADLLIDHTNTFAPGKKVITVGGHPDEDTIRHPLDDAYTGRKPNIFHYLLDESMRKQLEAKLHAKKKK